MEFPEHRVWGVDEGQAALGQVCDLCAKALDLEMTRSAAPAGFASKPAQGVKPGVAACRGELRENGVIVVEVLLVRCPGRLLVEAVSLFPHLSELGDKAHLLPPRAEEEGMVSLWAGVRVGARPMSLGRAGAFHMEMQRLGDLARRLQENLPGKADQGELLKLYKDMSDVLLPVIPWPAEPAGAPEELSAWSQEVFDLLEGAANLALASPHAVELDLALAVLSGLLWERGSSLATLVPPAIQARALLDLAGKAPGVVAVGATRLSLGASPYELGGEVQALLASLSQKGRPVIFTGAFEQLQAVLHGGQGGSNDPLRPVVLRAPSLPLAPLAEFAVGRAAIQEGGIPQDRQREIIEEIEAALEDVAPGEQRRLLPLLAARAARAWRRGPEKGGATSQFRQRVSALSETFAGLSPRPRASRRPQVQERMTQVLADPGLLGHLGEELLGQERALGELVARLRAEAMTRPSHQPLRYCAQGTPGTGKSESAALLARRLDIPYVNIDAASMPDFHTAAAQLLGSGRGIVMSHLPGRLEQVAKHHAGCLVEVSDLDHAPPQVRAPLADLFLQLLETGEAQSATGGMFSCANLILAFTMNLPEGADEEVRKGIGFNRSPSRREIRARVVGEIKRLLSGAFLSRVGNPIIFDPLDEAAMAAVIERAVARAIGAAAQRLGLPAAQVRPEPGLGQGLMLGMEAEVVSFGARAILERGRSLAAEAMLRMRRERPGQGPLTLRAYLDEEGNLAVEEV